MLYPITSGEELPIQERLTKGRVAVAVKAERARESAALLVNESVADGVPLLCGVKAILRDTPFPAGIVSGKGVSRTANCELLLETEEMVTLPPMALSSTDLFSVVPTATSPKLSVAGVMASSGLLTPMPVNAMFRFGPATKELPPTGPTAFGLKVTSSFSACPSARMKGNVAPPTENPAPSVCKPLRITLLRPVLVNTTAEVELAPTATLLNERFCGLTVTASLDTPAPASAR